MLKTKAAYVQKEHGVRTAERGAQAATAMVKVATRAKNRGHARLSR